MDPSFDILTHSKSCFLLDEDKARLAIYDEDRLRHYSKKLLGQAISLAFLDDVKAEDQKNSKDKKARQIAELQRKIKHLRAEVAEVS